MATPASSEPRSDPASQLAAEETEEEPLEAAEETEEAADLVPDAAEGVNSAALVRSHSDVVLRTVGGALGVDLESFMPTVAAEAAEPMVQLCLISGNEAAPLRHGDAVQVVYGGFLGLTVPAEGGLRWTEAGGAPWSTFRVQIVDAPAFEDAPSPALEAAQAFTLLLEPGERPVCANDTLGITIAAGPLAAGVAAEADAGDAADGDARGDASTADDASEERATRPAEAALFHCQVPAPAAEDSASAVLAEIQEATNAAPPEPPPRSLASGPTELEVSFADGPLGFTLHRTAEGPIVVHKVVPGSQAFTGGVQVGDRLLTVLRPAFDLRDQNLSTEAWASLIAAFQSAARPLEVTFLRPPSPSLASPAAVASPPQTPASASPPFRSRTSSVGSDHSSRDARLVLSAATVAALEKLRGPVSYAVPGPSPAPSPLVAETLLSPLWGSVVVDVLNGKSLQRLRRAGPVKIIQKGRLWDGVEDRWMLVFEDFMVLAQPVETAEGRPLLGFTIPKEDVIVETREEHVRGGDEAPPPSAKREASNLVTLRSLSPRTELAPERVYALDTLRLADLPHPTTDAHRQPPTPEGAARTPTFQLLAPAPAPALTLLAPSYAAKLSYLQDLVTPEVIKYEDAESFLVQRTYHAYALASDQEGIHKLLEDAAAGVNDPDEVFGLTPLHIAVLQSGGQSGTVEALLRAGGDVNAPAVAKGGKAGVTMTARGVGVEGKARVKIAEGATPVHLAAALRLDGLLALIMAGGGDASARDGAGRTPAFSAVMQYPFPDEALPHAARCAATSRCLATLLAWGLSLDAVDSRGLSALMYACLRLDAAATEALLASGASVTPASPGSRAGPPTAFHALAASVTSARSLPRENFVHILEQLLAEDEGASVGRRDHQGRTPLHVLLYGAGRRIAQELKRGGNGDAVTELVAEAAGILVQGGGEIGAADGAGVTPADLAGTLGIAEKLSETAMAVDRDRRKEKRKDFFAHFQFRRGEQRPAHEIAEAPGAGEDGVVAEARAAAERAEQVQREKLLKGRGLKLWLLGGDAEEEKRDTAGRGVDQVKGAISEAGQRLAERGEKLDQLSEKSEDLANAAMQFENLARDLRKQQEQQQRWGFW